MASFPISGADIELPRNLALLDTNVLIAYADPSDSHHAQARAMLEDAGDWVLGVAPPVIVEACSFLIGARKRRDRAEFLLQWLLTPGTVRLLPAPHGPTDVNSYLNADARWMMQHRIDYVDAFLMQMANSISVGCKFKPDLIIVTADMRDFLRCIGQGYAFRVYDLVSGDTLDMS